MTYVVEPLFAEWARFSDTRLSQTMLGHLGLNKASWSTMEPEASGSSEDGESDPARASEEPSSRALTQGSPESWHLHCPQPNTHTETAPPIPKKQPLIILPFPLFDLIYFILKLSHFPFDIQQYIDTSCPHLASAASFFFFFFFFFYSFNYCDVFI